THSFTWDISTSVQNPDGNQERSVITINGQWPAPVIKIKKGDRLTINVMNNLKEPTSLHFHGIFQTGSTFMDGASMISQCPIQPSSKFTYDFKVDQVGTFWYHSHSSAQYGDGLRGVLIVEDPEDSAYYDDNLVMSLSDWYYETTSELVPDLFISGMEPSINSALFNESHDVEVPVEKGKTYYLRLVNVGMSASQFFYIEDHTLTIIEVDGVRVEPVEVDSVKLATGQRYGALLTTKDTDELNFPIVQITNMMMHKKYSVNWLIYNTDLPNHADEVRTKNVNELNPVDDMSLAPLGEEHELLPEPTYQIVLEYQSDLYPTDGLNYYAFNHKPFIAPKVPTLNTVNYARDSKDLINPKIYGLNTNAIILGKDDIVEVIVNSNDHMRHPFHLHGHNFQVLSRGKKVHYKDSPASSETFEFAKKPLTRDTVEIPGKGYVQIRFKASNPGVWFFHCHTEWHAVQGLGLVFIEDPESIFTDSLTLPLQNRQVCEEGDYIADGNAIGNTILTNFTGEKMVYMGDLEWYEFGNDKLSIERTSSLQTSSPTVIESRSIAISMTSSTSATTSILTKAKETEMEPAEVSTQTKSKVLLVYFIIMFAIVILMAFALDYHTKRRRRDAVEFQRIKNIDLQKELEGVDGKTKTGGSSVCVSSSTNRGISSSLSSPIDLGAEGRPNSSTSGLSTKGKDSVLLEISAADGVAVALDPVCSTLGENDSSFNRSPVSVSLTGGM
ncbi:hypothetical protein WICPIJ_004222, partial [Wickerhamomyces pijperi]